MARRASQTVPGRTSPADRPGSGEPCPDQAEATPRPRRPSRPPRSRAAPARAVRSMIGRIGTVGGFTGPVSLSGCRGPTPASPRRASGAGGPRARIHATGRAVRADRPAQRRAEPVPDQEGDEQGRRSAAGSSRPARTAHARQDQPEEASGQARHGAAATAAGRCPGPRRRPRPRPRPGPTARRRRPRSHRQHVAEAPHPPDDQRHGDGGEARARNRSSAPRRAAPEARPASSRPARSARRRAAGRSPAPCDLLTERSLSPVTRVEGTAEGR